VKRAAVDGKGAAMRRHLPVALALALTAAIGVPNRASAQASQPFIGEVETFTFNFCPSGWLPLNGQLLAITDYEVLFNLIGTTFGGDGTTTFALPTAKPVFTADNQTTMQQCISMFGVFPSRN
jgi:microcystin-dependent protein